MEGQIDYIKEVDEFVEWLESFDCPFQIKVHTEEGMMTWRGGAGRPKRTPPPEKESKHIDKWCWKCAGCHNEYLVENCHVCSRCGKMIPYGRDPICYQCRIEKIRKRFQNDTGMMPEPFRTFWERLSALEYRTINLEGCVGKTEAHTCGLKHWGIWHPALGWMVFASGEAFHTTSRAVAEVQCDATRIRAEAQGDEHSKLHRVRCIKEWADEQHE